MTDLSDVDSSAFWRVNPKDADPLETREWLDAFDALIEAEGRERATYLLRRLLEHARQRRVQLPPVFNTPYRNSVGLADQPQFPGNLEIEQRLSSIVRWNALAMVVRANRAMAGAGRPHRQLRLGGRSVRGRLQSFLPRRGPRAKARGRPIRPGAISSTSSRIRRPASTRAPSSKAG